MKTILISSILIFSNSIFSQVKIGQVAGSVVKKKAETEAQDFNTQRSNREKGSNTLEEDNSKNTTTIKPDSTTAAVIATSETVYTFDFTLAYDFIDEKGKKISMEYFFGENAFLSKTEGMNSLIDLKAERMLLIDEKYKSINSLSTSMMKGMLAGKAEKKENEWTTTKTGNTKTILGHVCDEYQATNEKGEKQLMYVTTAITNPHTTKFAEYMGVNKYIGTNGAISSGVMLETIIYDKKGKEDGRLLATKALAETTTKDISTYRITKL